MYLLSGDVVPLFLAIASLLLTALVLYGLRLLRKSAAERVILAAEPGCFIGSPLYSIYPISRAASVKASMMTVGRSSAKAPSG